MSYDTRLYNRTYLVLDNADSVLSTERYVRAGTYITIVDSGAGNSLVISASGAAPRDSQYVVLSATSALDNERVLTAGTGIAVQDSGAGAAVTIVNTASGFNTVSVSGQSDLVADALQDTLTVAAGTGITVTTDPVTDTLTITNSSPNVVQNVFTKIAVSGQSDIDADSSTDTLTVAAGTGISLATTAGTDTLTISTTGLAANSEAFVTLGNTSGLTAERALTVAGGLTIQDLGTSVVISASGVTGSGGAPTDAQYVVLALNSSLSDERVLAVGTGLSLTDAGANGNVTLANTASSWNTISVSGQNDVVADALHDTLTLASGAGISITTDKDTDTVTIATTGLAANSEAFLTVGNTSGLSGERAIVAAGGLAMADNGSNSTFIISASALPQVAFERIQVSGQSDVVADSAADILTFAAGTGITITTTAGSDTVTITNSSPNTNQNLFETFAVSGQNSIVADSTTDTFTFAAGSGISLTTDDSTDTLTIATTGLAASNLAYVTIGNTASLSAERALAVGAGLSLTDGGANSSVTLTNTASSWNTISVSGQNDVVADALMDTLTLVAGSNISISTDKDADSVTFAVTGLAANSEPYLTVGNTSGLSAERAITIAGGLSSADNGANGTFIISASGLPQTAFTTVAVSGQSDVVSDSNADTLTFAAGSGIAITTNAGTDTVTIATTGLASDSLAYVTIGNTGSLSAERALAVGTGLSLTDGGANSTVTLTNTASSWNTISVSGQNDIVADALMDTLTVASGTGISLTTDKDTDTLTISTTGLASDSLAYITVGNTASLSGERALTAAGGLSMADNGANSTFIISASALPQTAFTTITVSGQSDIVSDSNADTLTIVAGTGISLTTNAGTDTLTITNSSPAQNAFQTVAVSGQSDVVADSTTDTLTLAAGSNIAITTTAGTDTVTFAVTGLPTVAFSTISVSGQSDVVADSASDTLTLVAGSNMTITTSAGGDSITFTAASGASNSDYNNSFLLMGG